MEVSAPHIELRTAVQEATPDDFGALALAVYRHQRTHNRVYRRFLELTRRLEVEPAAWREIPRLPIDLFRTRDVRSGAWIPEATFTSSGTTGAATSRHAIRDLDAYRRGCRQNFARVLGRSVGDFTHLGLLPSYLEREGSGLIAMVDDFARAGLPGGGFFLEDRGRLRAAVADAARDGRPVALWGVTFALLTLVADARLELPPGSVVIETGGMKGRGRELTRDELHARLYAGLAVEGSVGDFVYSEYGMTELQSQAYWRPATARFTAPPQMRVVARDPTDPFAEVPAGKTGALDVFDLANVDTCAFIQTDDLGRVYPDGTFAVLGRQDGARVRGCNLLLTPSA